MSNPVAVVARIAYLSSDVVVDSHPPLPTPPPFGPTYDVLAHSSQHRPAFFALPNGADPSSTLLRHGTAGLVSYTAVSSAQLLSRFIPHLAELSELPVVLHVTVQDDLSDVLLLRSSAPCFIYSSSPTEAHDHALLASRLARTERKLVVHAFRAAQTKEIVEEIDEASIRSFLFASKPASPKSNGHDTDHSTAASQLLRAYDAAAASTLALVRRAQPPETHHGVADPQTTVVVFGHVQPGFEAQGVSVVRVSLFSPLPASRLLAAIPSSAERVVVLEQVLEWATKWTPFYLEVVSVLQEGERERAPTVVGGRIGDTAATTAENIEHFLEQAASPSPPTPLVLGAAISTSESPSQVPHVPKHESSYTKILAQLFGDRLNIANSPALVQQLGAHATSPEFALGRVRGQADERIALSHAVQSLLEDASVPPSLHALLAQWVLAKNDGAKSKVLGAEVVDALQAAQLASTAAERVLALREHLQAQSKWIIGSDAWSYDLGASGLHHVIASGLNVNVLILDTVPYTSRNSVGPARRKQDVGLYGMNHGDVYVASVAVYSSYSQVLQALMEADQFDGPSVVLAYLPYVAEDTPALTVLKETKLAVDAGYWPLYRWDPSKEARGQEPFVLDSDAVKRDLQDFLDRQNHLSQLTRATPQLAAELVGSLGETVREARKKRAQQVYDDLVSAIDAPPLTILYASDGGKAEKVAKRLAGRGKARGLATTVLAMDTIALADLSQEEYVVFVTSTAGQGEFPQNGRLLVKALGAAAAQGERPFSKLRFSVFAMGDSHYWPRKEDAHYYNKAGKDLNARLEQLGGDRFAELGLGDDQDPDGPETGYKVWEPLVWKALGVDSVEVREAEPEAITNEHIKAASGFLRGTIAEGLLDTSTGALAPSDTQLTKFHGIYQQDDRDIRDERQAQGVEPAYSFMIRVRMPGGVCTPEQWLAMDQIADEHGCGTFKLTTRQTFQFHGVIKRHLKPAMQAINRSLLDTLAACGDVNRFVLLFCVHIPSLIALVCSPPETSSARLSRRCRSYMRAYINSQRKSANIFSRELLRTMRSGWTSSSLPATPSRTSNRSTESCTCRAR